MRLHLRRLAFVLYCALALHAQDAGSVLRYSVTYNTQRATLPLTPEQRSEAERFDREARAQARQGRFGDALRLYYQGMALMRNTPWTPALQFAMSLEPHIDHALLEPGSTATVTLKALYTEERTAMEKMTASIWLVPAKRDGAAAPISLAAGKTVDAAALPFSCRIAVPRQAGNTAANTAASTAANGTAGDWNVEIRLTPSASPHDRAATVRTAFTKTVPVHIEALLEASLQLRGRAAKHDGRKQPAAATAAYALALYDAADRGAVNPHRYQLRAEFAAAAALFDALDAGRDPFATRRGSLRKAYRSAVDNTLQPYRLFIPESYDGSRPAPLVVALHGMGGDENSMLDNYTAALGKEAQRTGMLVACPKGRDTASMYRGDAGRDVFDVIAEVRRDYHIDPDRIYLMGHSMGGFGTWALAMAQPGLFAALGPIAGGGNPAGMEKIAHIPQYVVHGDNDKTVSIAMSRAMVEAGRKAGAKIVFVEVPGGSHSDVVAPQFGPLLDFFARQRKAAAAGASH